jgi:hypothetical protein
VRFPKYLLMPLLIVSLVGYSVLLWQYGELVQEREQRLQQTRQAFAATLSDVWFDMSSIQNMLYQPEWDDRDLRVGLADRMQALGTALDRGARFESLMDGKAARIANQFSSLKLQLLTPGVYGPLSVYNAAVQARLTTGPVDPSAQTTLKAFAAVVRQSGFTTHSGVANESEFGWTENSLEQIIQGTSHAIHSSQATSHEGSMHVISGKSIVWPIMRGKG